MSDARAIGVFDSGIGGLTVVRQIRRLLPRENLVYLGDTARLPYGTKSAATVRAYAAQNLAFLGTKQVKAIVVACNTASAVALPRPTAKPGDLPIVGVIAPGAAEAIRRSRTGCIAVLGTRATVDSGAYERALRRLRPDVRVHARACPLFVPLAEEGLVRGALVESVVRLHIAPVLRKGVDTLVLGCTHYPLLATAIRRVAGPRVTLVDSATATARALSELLADRGLERATGRGRLTVHLTDPSRQFVRVARAFLGEKLARAHHVDL